MWLGWCIFLLGLMLSFCRLFLYVMIINFLFFCFLFFGLECFIFLRWVFLSFCFLLLWLELVGVINDVCVVLGLEVIWVWIWGREIIFVVLKLKKVFWLNLDWWDGESGVVDVIGWWLWSDCNCCLDFFWIRYNIEVKIRRINVIFVEVMVIILIYK